MCLKIKLVCQVQAKLKLLWTRYVKLFDRNRGKCLKHFEILNRRLRTSKETPVLDLCIRPLAGICESYTKEEPPDSPVVSVN